MSSKLAKESIMASPSMSRRAAIATGSAAAGMLFVNGCSQPVQETESPVSKPVHPPFLTPWSPDPNVKRDLTPGSTPIRLASWRYDCTLDYPEKISITEMVQRVHDSGFTAGNSHTGLGRRNPWLDATESEITELKHALQMYDILYFDVHTVVFNIHPDREERKKSIRHVIEQCEAAERVGCPMVTTHFGTRSTEGAVAPHHDNWTWETWKDGVASIKEILDATSGMNVELGIEAVNMTAMNNPKAHKQLMEDVGDPRCKVLLDPINMIYLGNYFRTTELIQECFELLGENIIAAHAKDTYVLPNKMSAYITEVAAGKGLLDYELYLVELSRLRYPRTLLIEHLPYEEYDIAKKYIDETAAKVGVTFYGQA